MMGNFVFHSLLLQLLVKMDEQDNARFLFLPIR